MGLDLGMRTLGVSLSDTTLTISNLYKTIRYAEGMYNDSISELREIVKENDVTKIILGFPKNMNNTIGPKGEIAIEFQKELQEKLNIEVILQDERLSTVEATNYMIQADISRKKRKKKIDGLAANIILQTYLDKEKGRNL
mgnify:FL=1